MQLLVIGGTHFVGRALVEDAVERGHEVTVFHRGPAEPEGFPQVEHVHGDRDGGLDGLAGARVGCRDRHVWLRPARGARLGPSAVGRGPEVHVHLHPVGLPRRRARGLQRGTPTHQPPFPDTEEITDESYGPLKVGCEREALDAFSGRCLVVRPGYIVGPHDPSDRFTYWVRRGAAGGRMLAPGPQDHALQVVDVRDLGAFTLDHVEAGTADIFGVVGPREPLTWGEAVPAFVTASGADTELDMGGRPVPAGAHRRRRGRAPTLGYRVPRAAFVRCEQGDRCRTASPPARRDDRRYARVGSRSRPPQGRPHAGARARAVAGVERGQLVSAPPRAPTRRRRERAPRARRVSAHAAPAASASTRCERPFFSARTPFAVARTITARRSSGSASRADVSVALHAVDQSGHGRRFDLLGLGELAHPPRPGEDQHRQGGESGSGDPQRLVLHAQASQQVDRGRVQAIGHRIHISRRGSRP